MNYLKRLLTLFGHRRQYININYVRIFRDEKLQIEFEKNGFVVLDFLSQKQINDLMLTYENETEHDVRDGFVATTYSNDRKYVHRIHTAINSIVKDSIDKHFLNYQLLFSNFLIKKPSPDSIISPHQDWTYVDEDKYFTINIWAARVDTQEHNGTLGIIRNSHRIQKNYRGTANPFINTGFGSNSKQLEPLIEYIPLKKGQAIAYDMRLLHASKANTSKETRFAIATAIIPDQADCWHCHQENNTDEIDIYKVGTDFMITCDTVSMKNSSSLVRKVRNEPFNLKDIIHLIGPETT